MYTFLLQKPKGLSLLELIVVMGIFSFLIVGVSMFMLSSYRYERIITDQLSGQKEARRAVSDIINVVRTAEYSSTGGYPIETATPYSLVFYANIDADNFRERIRYWITEDGKLMKGVVKPAGSPPVYNLGNEVQTVVAEHVVNQTVERPLFYYYDEEYIGSGDAMSYPLSVVDIRMVRVSIDIEKDVEKSPVPLNVESLTHIRNLKTN